MMYWNALKQYLYKLHQTLVKLNLKIKKFGWIRSSFNFVLLFVVAFCVIECGKSQKNISVGDNSLYIPFDDERMWNDGNDNQYTLKKMMPGQNSSFLSIFISFSLFLSEKKKINDLWASFAREMKSECSHWSHVQNV